MAMDSLQCRGQSNHSGFHPAWRRWPLTKWGMVGPCTEQVENWSWYHSISIMRAHILSITIALWAVQWLSSQKRWEFPSSMQSTCLIVLIRISFSEKDNSISKSLPHGIQVFTSEQLLKFIYKPPEQGSLSSILKQMTHWVSIHNFRAAVW